MELKNHVTRLHNLLPKSGEYPSILADATTILVEEQSDLIPIYMDGMAVHYMEAMIESKKDDPEMQKAESNKALYAIENFRNIRNMVNGMKRYGISGYPDMIRMTNDFDSNDPAVTDPDLGPYRIQIKPKDFKLGLTGRLLEDENGEKYSETLAIGLDIYDAYDFARSISPQSIVALTGNGRDEIVYKDGKNAGKTEKIEFKRNNGTFRFSVDRWSDGEDVLDTGGLRIVDSPFYEKIKKYGGGTILFGHKYEDIDEFLSVVTKTDNHMIWKICKNEINNPNTALIDAGPYYGQYKGKPRYENTDRLHFMPHKASIWFDGSMIIFDHQVGVQALMELGDSVSDVWIEPDILEQKTVYGWDIIYDKRRGIGPDNPVRVAGDADYQKFSVMKA